MIGYEHMGDKSLMLFKDDVKKLPVSHVMAAPEKGGELYLDKIIDLMKGKHPRVTNRVLNWM